MYQTSKVNPKDLGKIKIKNQPRIKEITGEELDPKKAWTIIKNESKNFTKESPKAKKADKLFAELMKVNGLEVSNASGTSGSSKDAGDDKERIRIRERERARAIEIMKLKLQIAA